MLDWITTLGLKAVLGTALIALIMVLGWVANRLRPARPDNQVRAGAFITGTGLLMAVVSVFLTWMLIFHEGLVRPDQFGWFLGVWAVFVFGSVYMLLIEPRFTIYHDASGVRWRGRFSGWRQALWSEIVDSEYSGWRQAVLLHLTDGTRIEISEYSDGLDRFAEAACRAGVPGVGGSIDPPRPPSRLVPHDDPY